VLAVEGGVVTHAAVVAGRGTVSVRHPDGLVSTYEPVHAQVTPGEQVDAGDVLGVVGGGTASSHCGARVCLHLGARRGGSYLDPWPLLAGGRLALLPLARVPP
jgi:murein DD-endopeptidase MepM/ murein hydrolase activator NlpD